MPPRNTMVLAICQALYIAAISIDLTLTGLVGYSLAPDKGLATLPFSLIIVGAAATTIFASFLMARIGRLWGFVLGALVGAAGGIVSVWAIFQGSFWGFCLGTACVGIFQAFAGYYRLAAADGVAAPDKGRAISTVMTGGVIAAVAGPILASWSKDLFTPVLFAGSYMVVTVAGIGSAALLVAFYRETRAAPALMAEDQGPARPLGRILRQPIYLAALANNVIGYATMMFIMTATPIAALACNHSIEDGADIIQWHLVGMYAPAFFSGRLIQRFGAGTVVLAGAVLSGACALIALASTDLANFYVALLCLGVGWNFMFVGGTSLLARAYRPSERAKAQAFSEFTTFGATALASLSAGQTLDRYGWAMVNLAVLPLLALAMLVTLWWLAGARRTEAPAHA